MKNFSYNIKDVKNNVIQKTFNLEDDLFKEFSDSEEKYNTSRNFIMTYWYNIWNKGFKDYYLYSGDRAAHIKNWQSNIAYGLIRTTIENYSTFASEKPLGYKVTGINQEGFKNRIPVQQVLGCTADKTLFNREIQSGIVEGLITGNFCFKTVYVKNKQTETAISIIGDTIQPYTFDVGVNNTPKTVEMDIFKVFPDPYSGDLRYITERDVVSHETFITRFKSMIMSSKNKLKGLLDLEELIKYIAINPNNANFEDFGRVRNEVFRKINEELGRDDTLPKLNYTYSASSSGALTSDQDGNITKGLIEYKCYTDNGRVTLTANGYPLYTGVNPEGKINYHYGNAYHTKGRFSEGIAYLAMAEEKLGGSILNVLVDGVRAISSPTFIAPKDLFIDPKQVDEAEPGDTLWTDGNGRTDEYRRVDKGGITDFGMLNIVEERGQRKTGVSEYNNGISSKERVATAVASLVESTNRRILKFLKKFSDTIADIGYFQLYLCRKHRTKPQWGYNMDNGEQVAWDKEITGKDLSGGFNISLETEGLLSVNKETEINKYIALFDKFAPTGIINSSNLVSDTFRASGLDPQRYVVNQNVIIPATKGDKATGELQTELPPQSQPGTETTPTKEAQQMQQAINPQIGA